MRNGISTIIQLGAERALFFFLNYSVGFALCDNDAT
jgi:hypothetical protein